MHAHAPVRLQTSSHFRLDSHAKHIHIHYHNSYRNHSPLAGVLSGHKWTNAHTEQAVHKYSLNGIKRKRFGNHRTQTHCRTTGGQHNTHTRRLITRWWFRTLYAHTHVCIIEFLIMHTQANALTSATHPVLLACAVCARWPHKSAPLVLYHSRSAHRWGGVTRAWLEKWVVMCVYLYCT